MRRPNWVSGARFWDRARPWGHRFAQTFSEICKERKRVADHSVWSVQMPPTSGVFNRLRQRRRGVARQLLGYFSYAAHGRGPPREYRSCLKELPGLLGRLRSDIQDGDQHAGVAGRKKQRAAGRCSCFAYRRPAPKVSPMTHRKIGPPPLPPTIMQTLPSYFASDEETHAPASPSRQIKIQRS